MIVRFLSVALIYALTTTSGFARPLDAIQARGTISLCAHPNALPFSTRKGEPRGFQIDIGEALAQELGVKLTVEWVITRFHPRTVDCDILLNAINDKQAQEESGLRLSRPYELSGVALAVRSDHKEVSGFNDLADEEKIGVLSGSMASFVLNSRGLRTSPFGFQDDVLTALASGEIDAAAVSPTAIGYYNHLNPSEPLRLIHAYESEPELRWTLSVGMRRADRPLYKAINAALERLRENGALRSIYARYSLEYRPASTK